MNLLEIIERLEKNCGPDLLLDRAIAFATQFRPEAGSASRKSFDLHEAKHDYATSWIAHRPWHNTWNIPAYTGSLAAVLDLAEQLLPGHGRMNGKGRCSAQEPLYGCAIFRSLNWEDEEEPIGAGEHDHEPAAALIAVFRAVMVTRGEA